MQAAEEENYEDENFFFESDHLAFRGNADYTEILKTIAMLHAQKIQAISEIDKIAAAEREALEDPEKFVEKLVSRELELPGPIHIIDLPKVNFEKYNVDFSQLDLEPKNSSSSSKENSQDITVRGRIFDQTKPETFNQLWTCEEQRRLEELLVEYPPEAVEMRRFAKIARALGNRTTKQVASRVQKFFKKLHSVGMPVPGRLPKSQSFVPKSHKLSRQVMRPSTFFPAQNVPVTMPEDDDLLTGSAYFDTNPQSSRKMSSRPQSVTSFDHDSQQGESLTFVVDKESDVESDSNTDSDLRVLKLLQRVRRDKAKDTEDRPESIHVTHQCTFCIKKPICGTMWKCLTCRDGPVSYCSNCLVAQLMSNDPHPISHKFVGLRVATPVNPSHHFGASFDGESEEEDKEDGDNGALYDKDYMVAKFSNDDNYMDPNFLPQ